MQITGDTYPYRHTLRALGASLDPESATWNFPVSSRNLKDFFEGTEDLYIVTRDQHEHFPIEVPDSLVPFPYQVEGATWLTQHRKGMLADEMGLGKTIQALLAAQALYIQRKIYGALIIAPASLVTNWEREASKWSPHLPIQVIAWSMLSKGIPPTLEHLNQYALIVDEAHYAKNTKSGRGKSFQKLCKRHDYVWLLTGTPMINRPSELFPLLKAIDHPLGRQWQSYHLTYCDMYQGQHGWVTSGAKNLDLLGVALTTHMLRRLKIDVLSDLPPKLRRLQVIYPDVATRDLLKEERTMLKEARTLEDVESEKTHFIYLAKLRREISLSKTPYIYEEALRYLEEELPLVIFMHHREAAKQVAELLSEAGYRVAQIHGEMSTGERQINIDSFQGGVSSVIVLTLGTGAEGITLTRASHIIMGECDWTPGRMAQAEDRCHRIGQKHCVSIVYMPYAGSVDAHVMKIAARKGEHLSELFGGDYLSMALEEND